MRAILGILMFYVRFGLSFSVIGYAFRKLFWASMGDGLKGRTVLITGASGGIGAAVAEGVIEAGGRVIAVARNPDKLEALAKRLGDGCETCRCDLSDSDAVRAMLNEFVAQGRSIDIVVNNVGVLLPDFEKNAAGIDGQFATNLLNPYLLTERIIETQLLAQDGAVITVASGGMYMAPLRIAALSSETAADHDGTRAYAVQKRAQVMLTQHWQSSYGGNGRDFYVLHPGWADTAGVQRSLPTFRRLMGPLLRNPAQGADTITWLAATRPAAGDASMIWLDRKSRRVHAYGFTRQQSQTIDELLNFLKRFL